MMTISKMMLKIIQMNIKILYIVLWTEAEQEFICVEPWMAMTDELNRKEELVMVEPGKSLHTSLVISVK